MLIKNIEDPAPRPAMGETIKVVQGPQTRWEGDTPSAAETPDGTLLRPDDQSVESQLQAGREFMREYSDTLRALAR